MTGKNKNKCKILPPPPPPEMKIIRTNPETKVEKISNNTCMVYSSEDIRIKPLTGIPIRLGIKFNVPENCFVLFQDIPEYVLRADVHVHPSTMMVLPSFEKEMYIIMKNDGNEESVIRKGNKLVKLLILKSEIINIEVE